MSVAAREAFLAEPRVGILSVTAPGRGPLSVPVWYDYAPGEDVRILTPRGSRKVPLIEAAGCLSLCVQTETRPYRYVSVEGSVSAMEVCDYPPAMLPIAARYLGDAGAREYVEREFGDAPPGFGVLVRMRPRRWFCADYALEDDHPTDPGAGACGP
jgi:hypothetical protein